VAVHPLDGRRYLRIDRAVDERLDPYRETEAAGAVAGAELPGAGQLAAGDHGLQSRRGRHAAARDQVGSDDIVQIVRHYRSPSFGFASRNYYCSFLAVLRLDRDPERYFGPLVHDKPVEARELTVSAPVRVDTLRHILDIDIGKLRELNPALRQAVWNLQQFVPRGYRLRLPVALAEWTSELLGARLAGADTSATTRLASAVASPKAQPAAKTPAAPATRVARIAAATVAQAQSNGPAGAACAARPKSPRAVDLRGARRRHPGHDRGADRRRCGTADARQWAARQRSHLRGRAAAAARKFLAGGA